MIIFKKEKKGGKTMKYDEKISFYTHLAGFILAVIGTIYLLFSLKLNLSQILVTLVYGISVSFLFLASSLYHYNKKAENEITIWRKLDHLAIFFMIAGSYTPIIYEYLSGTMQWTIIILQWVLVLGGFFFKFFYLNAPRILYTVIYLLMGWIGMVAIRQLWLNMSGLALTLLFAGGLSFTIGAIFYILKKPNKNPALGFHEIFHIFILLGAIFHYLLVYQAMS